MTRYALYFAPAETSAFWRFGSAWLGRDAATGGTLARPALHGPAQADWTAEALQALTAAPRRYGFHATLKPPFRLAEGRTIAELTAAAEAFAAKQKPFECTTEVAALGRFIAFRLASLSEEMAALAGSAVRTLDPFRAPPPPEETARRQAAGLTARQQAMLAEWGYPYVFEEFRFHMTLTGPINDEAARERLVESLRAMAGKAAGPLEVDAVAIYEQPAPDAPFTLFRRLPLGG